MGAYPSDLLRKAVLKKGCRLNKTERLVVVVIAQFLDRNGVCFPSVDRVAVMADLGRSTVMAALRRIDELGWPLRRSAPGETKGRRHRSNRYTVSDEFLVDQTARVARELTPRAAFAIAQSLAASGDYDHADAASVDLVYDVKDKARSDGWTLPATNQIIGTAVEQVLAARLRAPVRQRDTHLSRRWTPNCPGAGH